MARKSLVLNAALPIAIIALVVALFTAGVSAQRLAKAGDPPPGQARAAGAQKRGLSEAQKANVRDRVAVATRILDKHQAEAEALGMPADWRRPFYEQLLPLPVDGLLAVEGAESLQALSVAAAAEAVEPQSIGSSSEDLVYTPITPCRFIDTRYVAAGRIDGYRGFNLSNDGASYGGSAACDPLTLFGVTDDDAIGAVAMNVTIVNTATAPGWLAVKPTQAAPVSSWLNWYQAGPTVQTANMGIATPDGTGIATDFWIQTYDAAHVIVNLAGAFMAPEATAVQTTFVQTAYPCPSSQFCSTTATCPAGYALTGGGLGLGVFVAGFDIVWNGPGRTDVPGFNPQMWVCQAANGSPSGQTMYCTATCARIPGR